MRPQNIVLVLVTLALLPIGAAGSALDPDTLARELDRLGTLVTDPALGNNGERLQALHGRAAKALRRGHPHQALYEMQRGLVGAAGYLYLAEHKGVESLEAFDRLWQEQSLILEQTQRIAQGRVCLDAPIQVRALVERAANRATGHYRAARAMAHADNLSGGLYYLGQARAEARLAKLCKVFRAAGLAAASATDDPDLPSLADELPVLARDTGTAYEAPGAALERHSEFIALNASLKELGELDAAGLRYGALDRFLDARLRLSLLQAQAGDDPPAPDLGGEIDRLTARLTQASRDHSLALAYLERAASTIDDPESGERDRLAAERIVSLLIPTYLQRIGPSRP
ncbi:MAG: hypothetical protein AAF657_24515 [Acidobacteriota bacterium]